MPREFITTPSEEGVEREDFPIPDQPVKSSNLAGDEALEDNRSNIASQPSVYKKKIEGLDREGSLDRKLPSFPIGRVPSGS